MANPNGGPSKLLRLKDRSLAAARQGHTLEAACGGLGVHRSANLHWLAASRTASSGQYRDFLIAYEDAQNTAERVLTSKLLAAANKEPRVLMWILERRFPGNWRLQQHQAFSGSAGQLLELRVSKERETRDSHSSYPIG
jgi:hypothetical protein